MIISFSSLAALKVVKVLLQLQLQNCLLDIITIYMGQTKENEKNALTTVSDQLYHYTLCQK